MINSDYRLIKKSNLFDERYYLMTYPDVVAADIDPILHYIKYGAKEGRNPSDNFNTLNYQLQHIDIDFNKINPLVHHIQNDSERQSYSISSNIFKIIKLLKQHGTIITLKKIKHHIFLQKTKTVHDLISLKTVDNSWKSQHKLTHSYQISVIIPTYNRGHMLYDLLTSWKQVAKVTRYSFEIIFSDDGSIDESVNILQSVTDLPIKVLANKHGGAAKARNTAINAAKGEKLFIIGDDIFPNENILNQHYEKLKELEPTDAILGECVWHPNLKINHLMDHITKSGCEQFSFEYLPKNGYTDFRHFYTCNISIDREFLLSEKTIFDEAFYKVNFEDIELGYRLAKKGMKIYYFPEAWGHHLHPYDDVKKFCIRQETAGEMAIVFKKLHKEIEVVVDIDNISNKWNKYTSNEEISSSNIYEELIVYCQYIEDNFDTYESDYSNELSILYKELFRFAYEKGVFEKSHSIHQNIINNVLYYEFYTKKFKNALKKLNDTCNVSNYKNLIFSTDHKSHKHTLLTIIAFDQEQIYSMMEYYKPVKNYVRLALKTEENIYGFVYQPEKSFLLPLNALQQVLLFLQKYPHIDLILLSYGLNDLPKIGIADSINNSYISKYGNTRPIPLSLNQIKGKILRIFETPSSDSLRINTFFDDVIHMDEFGFFSKTSLNLEKLRTRLKSYEIIVPNKKPIIFVLPIFLAVGGAEKNTLEVINYLQVKYDFVIINFERLNETIGSLHHQFMESCVAIYDLTELSEHSDILDYLRVLNETYNPQMVWICNGSPWFAQHTSNIREVFSTIPIVDQQVYDAQEGWINIFDDPGIHSYDRFIAINSKIKNVFINHKGIPSSKIDLIYHVVKSEKFHKKLYVDNSLELAKKYNIDKDKKNFVFVGRSADQKRPFLFLEMVELIQRSYPDYKFIMVGDGPLSNDIDKIIESKKLDSVTRMKFVEKVAELYSLVDGLIITSKFEGLPIAMLEAMCMELPVFATNVGDIDVVINEYHNGTIVPVDCSSTDLYNAFIDFDKNIHDYKLHAINTSERIRNRFSEKTVATHYDNCFQKAIKEKS